MLMRRAAAAVEALPDGFVAARLSNGGGMSGYVATQRRVSGVLMLSGALPLDRLGADAWPAGVPAQIHYTVGGPFRRQESIDTVAASIRAAGSPVEGNPTEDWASVRDRVADHLRGRGGRSDWAPTQLQSSPMQRAGTKTRGPSRSQLARSAFG